ncbi:hypothetical protein [Rhodococcus koreensis]
MRNIESLNDTAWSNTPMQGFVKFNRRSREQLRAIGAPEVKAEIHQIAVDEILDLAHESAIEGRFADVPVLMWRRAIRRVDLGDFDSFEIGRTDEDRYQASNYVLVYRWMTDNEHIKSGTNQDALLVVSVLLNHDWAHLLGEPNLLQTLTLDQVI